MPFQLIEKQIVYEGQKIRLEIHELADECQRRIKKEICVHRGAVVILPFLDARTVMLIRNRRYTVDQMLVELPAGTLERYEQPLICAGRELLEETGYQAGRLEPLGSFYASPGILTEKMHVFAAYDLTKHSRALEIDEEIELLPTAFGKAIEMIKTGEIVDGKTIAILLMYERFHLNGRA